MTNYIFSIFIFDNKKGINSIDENCKEGYIIIDASYVKKLDNIVYIGIKSNQPQKHIFLKNSHQK